MSDSIIKLYPRDYKTISERIIFWLGEGVDSSVDINDLLFKKLRTARTFVVSSYFKKGTNERRYNLFIDDYVLNFFGSKDLNLHCNHVLTGKRAKEKREQLYKTKLFTIIPKGSVHVVYNGVIYPDTEDNSWKMDENVFNDLLDSMNNYFNAEDEEVEQKEERIKIPDRFKANIIRPFKEYTDKENWVEQYKQSQGEGIEFFKSEYFGETDNSKVYGFYSNDKNAFEENDFFSIGDHISVFEENNNDVSSYTGVLEDVDKESSELAIYRIAFYRQLDHVDMPKKGKLVLGINDTQTRVRSKVIRSMESGKLESKYMYEVFNKFSPNGYEKEEDDLKKYLAEKMASEHPPNQMQLEAIIKGILTDDLLLVLGPPGTGKTTVISFWVEYFINKGMKVLISSQNNAAVDNVLARFGKLAETVRLGNENKVQEDCKRYLPQKKIETIQENFITNYDRVKSDIDKSLLAIEKYDEQLNEYHKTTATYNDIKNIRDLFIQDVNQSINVVNEKYKNFKDIEQRLNTILEERAAKEIFLEVYKSKWIIERILRFRYAKKVKQELESTNTELSSLRINYRNATQQYNASVEAMKGMVAKAKEERSLAKYIEVKRKVESCMKDAINSGFSLTLFGEVKSLYSHPVYEDSAKNFSKLIDNEILKIAELREKINSTRKILEEWNDTVNDKRNDVMQNVLLETCQIVGATCIGINSNRMFSDFKFDVAIVDESGQIQIHNALVPMSRARKNLLLGDYKQIPPIANDDVVKACEAEGIDTKLLNMSFFEYVFESMKKKTIKDLEAKGLDKSEILKPILKDYKPEPYKKFDSTTVQNMISRVVNDPKKIVNLNSQFRMPGNISDIISEWFYENNYFSSYNMSNFKPMVPQSDKPLVVVRTSDYEKRFESQPESNMGYQNFYEAKIVVDIVENVINSKPEDERVKFVEKIESNIGIISAYGAQVRLIREQLSKRKLGISETQIRSMVASLDSFQGQERPLILYSLTRSTIYKKSDDSRVGFMKELRRLNVAFTRCQKQLVIIGDIDYLTKCKNMEEGNEWPCANVENEADIVRQEYIDQCASCEAVCERKFGRFMRLLMQHVNSGAGNIIDSKSISGREE